LIIYRIAESAPMLEFSCCAGTDGALHDWQADKHVFL
jgi:hypothetical protein